MDVLDRYFGVHGDALALRSKRLEILASNIANAATPNFKARDIDFAAELKRAETGGSALAATETGHIPGAAAVSRHERRRKKRISVDCPLLQIGKAWLLLRSICKCAHCCNSPGAPHAHAFLGSSLANPHAVVAVLCGRPPIGKGLARCIFLTRVAGERHAHKPAH